MCREFPIPSSTRILPTLPARELSDRDPRQPPPPHNNQHPLHTLQLPHSASLFLLPPASRKIASKCSQLLRPIRGMWREGPIPRSTAHYHRRAAREEEETGIPRKKYAARTKVSTCSKCKLPREMQSHTQYYGSWYCANTAKETKEEWRARMVAKREEKRGPKEWRCWLEAGSRQQWRNWGPIFRGHVNTCILQPQMGTYFFKILNGGAPPPPPQLHHWQTSVVVISRRSVYS